MRCFVRKVIGASNAQIMRDAISARASSIDASLADATARLLFLLQ